MYIIIDSMYNIKRGFAFGCTVQNYVIHSVHISLENAIKTIKDIDIKSPLSYDFNGPFFIVNL